MEHRAGPGSSLTIFSSACANGPSEQALWAWHTERPAFCEVSFSEALLREELDRGHKTHLPREEGPLVRHVCAQCLLTPCEDPHCSTGCTGTFVLRTYTHFRDGSSSSLHAASVLPELGLPVFSGGCENGEQGQVPSEPAWRVKDSPAEVTSSWEGASLGTGMRA